MRYYSRFCCNSLLAASLALVFLANLANFSAAESIPEYGQRSNRYIKARKLAYGEAAVARPLAPSQVRTQHIAPLLPYQARPLTEEAREAPREQAQQLNEDGNDTIDDTVPGSPDFDFTRLPKIADPVASKRIIHSVKSPLPGVIMALYVKKNDRVKKGQPMVEAKAENMHFSLLAPADGQILRIDVGVNDSLEKDDDVLFIVDVNSIAIEKPNFFSP